MTLLRTHQITDAVFVAESASKSTLFEYTISAKAEDIQKGTSSKYYPIELSNVLKQIKNKEGSYAIVALPCFAKAIRLLQRQYPVFRKRIKYIISPVCGHLKSKRYAEFLAAQKDIHRDDLVGINFRKKLPDESASQYGTEFTIKNGNKINTLLVKNRTIKLGTNWGHGMFKYSACDYCDDTFGETSDISIGDAWLKEYLSDYKGNSVVTTRNLVLDGVVRKGIEKGELFLETADAGKIIQSQSGGIQNKTDDLSYRLYIKLKEGEGYPKKRVEPGNANLSKKRKCIIRQRMIISHLSHTLYKQAIDKNDLSLFAIGLSPEIQKYNNLYSTFIQKIKNKFKILFLLIKLSK